MMPPPLKSSESSDPLRAAEDVILTGGAHRVIARFAGGLLLAFGVFALAFLAWAVERNWGTPGSLQGAAIGGGVFAVVGAFCLGVGYRLLFLRPNAYGHS